ncbi:MAG: hypothetical protein P8181_11340, partial [bacterium]
SPQAWDTFFSLREGAFGVAYAAAWARQIRDGRSEPTQFQVEMAPMIEAYRNKVQATMSPEELEKAIVYLSVGSQNMDYRGMFLDGEVAFVASLGGVLTGVLDLLHLIQVSDWVDDYDDLDKYMGSYGWFTRQMSRWATPMM